MTDLQAFDNDQQRLLVLGLINAMQHAATSRLMGDQMRWPMLECTSTSDGLEVKFAEGNWGLEIKIEVRPK